MHVEISHDELSTLLSMNEYWEEISHRTPNTGLIMQEFAQLRSVLTSMQIMLIVGEWAKKQAILPS